MNNETITEGSPHILIMEDDDSVARGLQMILTKEGYTVDWAPTGRGALDKCGQKPFDLLMADLRLPDINGMEVIKQVKRRWPETVVVVITEASSISSAVEAIKIGAFDYLEKPFSDDKIKSVVEKALKAREVARIKERLEAVDPEKGKLIQKREVARVLDRASQDMRFWRTLMEKGSEALSEYELTSEAKAAIISGDSNWILKNTGDLTDEQLKWIRSRLEMERW